MPARSATMEITRPRYRFTVADYFRMGEAGILGEEDRVELIRGEILVMTPIGSRHAACVNRLIDVFDGVRGEMIRSTQNPIVLPDSVPQPDLLLLARREDYYASAHPTPADVRLIVEVADSSLLFDREVKGPLYAENGVLDSWIVNLRDDRIEVHRRPEGGAWRETFAAARGESLSPAAFPDFEVRADDVLP